jgi:putative ABC transport system permease protein
VIALRASSRLAWRQAARNRWRSALVVAMVALPIAALAGAASVVATVIPTPAELATERMGTAAMVVDSWPAPHEGAFDPVNVARHLPPGARLVSESGVGTQNIVHGSAITVDLEEFSVPVDRAPIRGMFTLLSGRAPAHPGEVALDPRTLAAMRARVGEEVSFDDVHLRLRVTGTAVKPDRVNDPLAVVGPGTLPDNLASNYTGFFVDGSASSLGAVEAALRRAGLGFSTRKEVMAQDRGAALAAMAASFGATAVILFATGLVAAAAFAVGTRRRLRTIGLVGALGGSRRHARAVVLLEGTLLGLVGSLLGVGLGVMGSAVLHHWLPSLAGRELRPVAIPWLALGGTVLLGTLAGTIAALGPARTASRIPVTQALAGRMPASRPPGRVALAGAFVVIAGAPLVWLGTSHRDTTALSTGLVVMGGGFLLAIPLLVSLVGRGAGRLPTALRLAARHTARNGRRTGAALAAATLALALPVAIAAKTLGTEAGERVVPFMAPDQFVLTNNLAPNDRPGGSQAQLLADIARAFPGSVAVRLTPRWFRVPTGQRVFEPNLNGQVDEVPIRIKSGAVERLYGTVYVGGPDMLRALHAENGIPALLAGKAVGIGPGTVAHGVIRIHGPTRSDGTDQTVSLPAVEAGATRYASVMPGGEFGYVVSAAVAERLGLVAIPNGGFHLLVRAPHALTGEDTVRAKDLASRYSGIYEYSNFDLGSHGGRVRLWAMIGGAALGLAILAVALALVRAEARREEAVMVAVGAPPGTRRKVAAANALLISLLAGVLAAAAGFLPVAIVERAQTTPEPVVVPWAALAGALLVVPVLAGAAAAAVSRRPPSSMLLRPTE